MSCYHEDAKSPAAHLAAYYIPGKKIAVLGRVFGVEEDAQRRGWICPRLCGKWGAFLGVETGQAARRRSRGAWGVGIEREVGETSARGWLERDGQDEGQEADAHGRREERGRAAAAAAATALGSCIVMALRQPVGDARKGAKRDRQDDANATRKEAEKSSRSSMAVNESRPKREVVAERTRGARHDTKRHGNLLEDCVLPLF